MFFTCLRKLAGKHARLPDSMVIKDDIYFSKSVGPYISGGSADLKLGQHGGCTIAVKKMRVAMSDDFERIGKVRKIFSQSGGWR